ncbi:MAG: MerR family transcriptional regulator [Actinobacteria bacterium]|nr:MAG: MerR family transcriptional regulator [Actinomycetota bacterium]
MVTDNNFLSIGEVLGLLLEEFPDVTISKIRFLESQGLIEPERTASGYRKFSRSEVERLKFILREQRENYLPLKIIRSKLESDTSDGMIRPYDDTSPHIERSQATNGGHPSARQNLSKAPDAPTRKTKKTDDTSSISRSELLQELDASDVVLKSLVANGLVKPRLVGDIEMFSPLDKEIVEIASRFIDKGIDVRHLKTWKHTAEREFGLFEQRIMPFLRQRNPAARQEAMELLRELTELADQLRSAFVTVAARGYDEGRTQ